MVLIDHSNSLLCIDVLNQKYWVALPDVIDIDHSKGRAFTTCLPPPSFAYSPPLELFLYFIGNFWEFYFWLLFDRTCFHFDLLLYKPSFCMCKAVCHSGHELYGTANTEFSCVVRPEARPSCDSFGMKNIFGGRHESSVGRNIFGQSEPKSW